ncbi:MAG TPA: alpha/beta fold hydrolase [Phenylobacterium sp.]|nr:alpha/beta fold hydrolase [Phenylobacterium sp.]
MNDRPTIVLEHGAFGCAADWAEVQARLAARGLRSIAYDRAGLGHSDPGPKPRDGRAIVADLAALLRGLDEEGPVVLVGHSMGGLMVRLFALTHPHRVLGLVLVDAVTPDLMGWVLGARAVRAFDRALRLVSRGARLGMMRPMAAIMGDRIGLSGEAGVEKRRIYGLATHAHWASEEVSRWPVTSDQARMADLPPNLPIAVITAGAENTARALKAIQVLPALASRNGYVEHVAGAGHASLLGRRFADPIVRGIDQVLAAARR